MNTSCKDSSTLSSASITRRDVLQGLMTTGMVCASGAWAVDPACLRVESKPRANAGCYESLD